MLLCSFFIHKVNCACSIKGGSNLDSNCYKILAIDGGGIKGLYSAIILSQFEDEFGPIHHHFNLIRGTSTGGIIALALASGIKAAFLKKDLNLRFFFFFCKIEEN
ncbi:hypothetical protein G5B47_18810 [Paenibacillus sp. 7124]|uniref:PNPLA domain-containing protein n=1 Tax=Paenibacillus apii TaxID=1850370 RepID=A0A6M1PQR9_9BACL|nr:hypothetical protein [Paenibacillus apii]NJJ40418.1 hypothetical protein [Paenibacillus apii]